MHHNIAVDWNVFSCKFSGKEEITFQKLAYLLFCAEHNLPWGIFSYHNQVGIETEPISFEGHIVGFQAKYYNPSTSLSSKTSELKKMIDDSKRKNPNISKILIYINKEFTESTKKDGKKPKYQTEVETHGKDNNIIIEWKVKSHIEASLVLTSISAHVRDYFFNPSNGIKEFFEQVKEHTNLIIDNIENEICFNNKRISIKRPSSKINDFMMSDQKCLIIYGESGTGKSGIIRDFVINQNDKSEKEKYPIFVFRATDFVSDTTYSFTKKFGDISFDDFLSVLDNYEKKAIIIDAAEKVVPDENNILHNIIPRLIDNGWKIIVTIRTTFKDAFINYILKTDAWETLEINNISLDSLNQHLSEKGVKPPNDSKLQLLICNLFYLKLYIQTYDEKSNNATKTQFYSKIWDLRIKGISHCKITQSSTREQIVCSMFQTIIKSNAYYYVLNQSNNHYITTIEMLIEDAVIAYDETFGGYHFTHDVFEEMVARHIIEREYTKYGTFVELLPSLDTSLPMRKHYRHWLLEKLEESLVSEIPAIFTSNKIDKIWKDESLIAMMTDPKGAQSLAIIKDLLSQNNFALLHSAIFLLNTACRVVDKHFFTKLTDRALAKSILAYKSTQPSGAGWEFIIRYIAENKEDIPWSEKFINPVVEVLTVWVDSQKHGNVTHLAGEITLFLYNKQIYNEYPLEGRNFEKKIFKIIASASHEIKTELINIINSVIETTQIDRALHIDLCKYLISNIVNSIVVCETIPESIITLCDKLWRETETEKNRHHQTYENIESAFGLNPNIRKPFPSSAFQTPTFLLLKYSPHAALKFIIDFLNYTSNHFYEYSKEHKDYKCTHININAEASLKINQICSEQLWLLYRGISTDPDLLKCILMALEKWLLEHIKHSEAKSANDLCKHLLMRSNNVGITSVVTSVVIAYPEKLFETALWLIRIKDIFELDIKRAAYENCINLYTRMPENVLYDEERLASNKLEFRKQIFSRVILNYQIRFFGENKEDWVSKKTQLYRCIDELAGQVQVEDVTTRRVLNRIDLRKYHSTGLVKTTPDGEKYTELTVTDEPDLVEIQEEKERKICEIFKYTDVSVWASKRYANTVEDYSKYPAYENSPVLVINELKKIIDDVKASKINYMAYNTLVFGAVVLIRDFRSQLTEDQVDFCCNILLESMSQFFSLEPKHEITDSLVILSSMPYLFGRTKPDSDEHYTLIRSYTFALLTDYSNSQKLCQLFATTMWGAQPTVAAIVFSLFVNLTPDFRKLFMYRETKKTINHFLACLNQKIKKTIKAKKGITTLPFSDLNVNDRMKVSLMLDASDETHYELFVQVLSDGIFQRIFNESHRNDNSDELNHHLVTSFIAWLAGYIYFTSEIKAKNLIKLIMKNANSDSQQVNKLLSEILAQQDKSKNNNKFWHIWHELFPYIKAFCEKSKDSIINSQNVWPNNFNDIITTYCFAWPYWGDQQKQWIGVQRKHLSFFSTVTEEIGYVPVTLYAFSRFLCTIGSNYTIEGISWLSTLIVKNENLPVSELPTNTIQYIENMLMDFVTKYENDIRKKEPLRKKVLIILNYLVERGSTVGFLIREKLL
ncbi:MAG: hypothetical protein LBH62_07935 [Nitrososphaerota archaeon]|jgi:hypothetical protein|nr:hypothetical protein [Nitrososphaerota archaeon]